MVWYGMVRMGWYGKVCTQKQMEIGQDRTGQDWIGYDMIRLDTVGYDRIGQDRIGQDQLRLYEMIGWYEIELFQMRFDGIVWVRIGRMK